MTGHDVNTFAASLVEMALATKRLPEAEQELSEANSRIDGYLATIQRLELKLMARANEIDTLKAQVRTAEVARDDAELRFLECDDAKSTLERTLETITGEISGVLAAVRPPVPQPPVEPEVKLVESPLHPVQIDDPNLPVAPSNPEASTAESPIAHSAEGSAVAGQGESAADPTSAPTLDSQTQSKEQSLDGGDGDAKIAVSSSTDEGQHPGPFASSSSSEQSSTAGGGAENSGNAGSPQTQPDPEPSDKWSQDWWNWNDRQAASAS